MEIKKIGIDLLLPNLGQIEGLPTNPRQWTPSDIDKIAASLAETPELFDSRPIIAVPHDGKFIILGGNLRYEGAKMNGMKEVPCVILEGLSTEKMKEIVIKDNGSFGAWDNDILLLNWSDLPLPEWGVTTWGGGEDYSNNKPKEVDISSINDKVSLSFECSIDEAAEINKFCVDNGTDIKSTILDAIRKI